jgi:hypothetical protein
MPALFEGRGEGDKSLAGDTMMPGLDHTSPYRDREGAAVDCPAADCFLTVAVRFQKRITP